MLPLKLRWPRGFNGMALCIGSMAPDLEFVFRLSDDWLFSHTLAAQLYFGVPVTMLLVWLLTAVVLPVVLPFVRDHPRLRLHDLAALEPPRHWRAWASVALSALLGGLSHWLLDGVTHGGHSGWAVAYLPWLRMLVPHVGGAAPLHDALQLWLTLLCSAASIAMYDHIVRHRLLWRWRGREPEGLLPRHRSEGIRLGVGLALLSAYGAVLGHQFRSTAPAKLLAAGVAFGAVNFALGGVLLFALGCLVRRRLVSPTRTLLET